MHTKYFENQNSDIRDINLFYINNLLNNYNIIFSGILNKNQKIEDIEIYH